MESCYSPALTNARRFDRGGVHGVPAFIRRAVTPPQRGWSPVPVLSPESDTTGTWLSGAVMGCLPHAGTVTHVSRGGRHRTRVFPALFMGHVCRMLRG